MNRAPFQLARLTGAHDRTTIYSEQVSLDKYIREQLTQDIGRRVAACIFGNDGRIAHRCWNATGL